MTILRSEKLPKEVYLITGSPIGKSQKLDPLPSPYNFIPNNTHILVDEKFKIKMSVLVIKPNEMRLLFISNLI